MYNTKFLVRTQVKPPIDVIRYEYRREIKIIGFTLQKEGIYTAIGGNYRGTEPLNENQFIKNKTLYNKPCVVLHYANEHSKAYYFDTLAECYEFEKGFTVNKEWIK